MICLVGCSCKDKTVKVELTYEEMPKITDSSEYMYKRGQVLSYDLKTIEQYDEKVENKDNFFLVIYRNGCYGCELLAPALGKYVKENQVPIYTLSLELIGNKHSLRVDEGITETPYFVLIEEGTVAYKEYLELSATDAEENIKLVKNWMDKHIEWGN